MEQDTTNTSDERTEKTRPTARLARDRVAADRIERMFQAARLYYEGRKLNQDSCPHCGASIDLKNSVSACCHGCGMKWTADHKVRLNQEEVAQLLSSPIYRISRSEIQRLLAEAEDYGMVGVLVTRAPQDAEIRVMEEKLRRTYNLAAVRLVSGREDLFDPTAETEVDHLRALIIQSAARSAAEMIVSELTKVSANHARSAEKGHRKKATSGDAHPEAKHSTLCLAWGFTMHHVVSQLRPEFPLPNLHILPMVGALSTKPFDMVYDSNLLVQEAARAFKCEDNAYWLPAPAFVRDTQQIDTITGTPLIADILSKMRDVTMIVSSVGFPDPAKSTLVKHGLFTVEDITKMQRNRAVGEIGGHFFDRDGEPVQGIHPIGLDIHGIKSLVAKGKISLAIVAGNNDRVYPLRVAISKGLVNALVTDHVTAERLLIETA